MSRTTKNDSSRFTLRVTDAGEDTVRTAIERALVDYNAQTTGVDDHRPLAVVVDDSGGAAIGGLWGGTAYGWLYVDLLFVPEPLRGRGVGAELMRRAEIEAVRRGCHSAWLDTFEFQARGFYERLGYRCFAELADYPAGFSRYFMTKRLAAAASGRDASA